MEQKLFFIPWMRRDEVKEAIENKAILLVPIATIEQHGPHAPLHTDIDNVTHICLEVARRLNPEPRVLVAPPIWFSPSPFDVEVYPCCVKMRREVYMDALNDILETYLRSGFKRIIVVNGHGGGTERWIPQVIDRINWTKKSLIWPDWRIPADAQVYGFCYISFLGEFAAEELAQIRKNPLGSDWHAGDMETSLQLYLHPDLVDMSKAKKGWTYISTKYAPSDLANWHRQFIIDGYYPPAVRGEEEGISGDPTLSSKELGEKIFELAVTKIAEFVKEVASYMKR
jgi:creatinine amidohydrolase